MAGNLELRVASEADAEAVAAIYAPYVLETVISFEEEPPSADDMAGRIASTLRTHPFLVCAVDDCIAGFAYGGPHSLRSAYRWTASVSVYVERGRHRQGVGRALYLALFDRLGRQGVHALIAGIALPNEKSVGLHESLGFEPQGVCREVGFKFGAWHDVGYWRLGLRQGAPGAEPVPFPLLAEQP
jgi:phosphinothricin acetyltransferase